MFQNYALFPHLTVFDNIAFGLRLRRVAKPRDRRAGRPRSCASSTCRRWPARFPAQLSGGQQQRVAIARSLVLEPRILMFDEPLSNLDFKLRIQMRDELKRLQRRLGKTAIYVTHDQTEALALSDRIAVLSHGHIEQIGTPGEIYERPATAFVAEFIGSSNLFAGAHRRAGRARRGGRDRPAGCGCAAPRDRRRRTAAPTVSVLLRPERIGVRAPGAGDGDGPNRFPARVADVTYLGEDLHLGLELGRRADCCAPH